MAEAPIIPLRGAPPARSLADRDDDELMLLVRAGVPEALPELVARYHLRLSSFCAKQLRDRAAAEEAVQDTFLRLWRHRATYRAEGKLATLLYTTARNLCRNQARSSRRRARWLEPAPVAIDQAAAAPEHLDALVDRERQRELLAAVGELSDKLREVVILRFEHGLAYDQIAAIVGAGESTVRSRVHLGIKALRERVGGRQ